MNYSNDRVLSELREVLSSLKSFKPNDRGEKDRRYAIMITEMEKLVAYFYYYVIEENVDGTSDE